MTRLVTLVALGVLVVAGVLTAGWGGGPTVVAAAATTPDAPSAVDETYALEADIALFERRVREDPASAADRARLAAFYLRRSRATGSVHDIDRAVQQAERSLALREGHNAATWGTLASARLAQHDFVGALAAAQALVRDDPDSPDALALEGEVLLELGRYDEAARRFAIVERASTSLTLAPRLSRWYEVSGHIDRALLVSRYALRLATSSDGVSREQVAWFATRVGDLAAKRGERVAADSMYRTALAAHPDDHRVLASQARLAANHGDWRTAVAAGESAIALHLDPATLGVLRDAWLALGDTAQATSYAAAMTASALTQPGAIHRAWGMHLVEHGERLGQVLRRVRREAQERRDVYGADLEAWTLHAMGRDAEASRAMQRALRVGTEDALLWYHAGVIAAAEGDSAGAREYLARALAFNPSFGVRHVVAARELLAALGGVAAAGPSTLP